MLRRLQMTLADSFKKLNLTQDSSALATKTLLFKSKKSQLPILVLADANAPASATEIGKKINVKDLRAADDSLWTTVLKAAKADGASLLASICTSNREDSFSI